MAQSAVAPSLVHWTGGFHARRLLVGAMEVAAPAVSEPSASAPRLLSGKLKGWLALVDHLEVVLNGKAVSSDGVGSRNAMIKELSVPRRIHPADLWMQPPCMSRAVSSALLQPNRCLMRPQYRPNSISTSRYVIESQHPVIAQHLEDFDAAIAARCRQADQRSFWQQSAAFTEVIQHGLPPTDGVCQTHPLPLAAGICV